MTIPVAADALVVLVGATGAGKSTFAGRHFRSTEVVSSDACRALVADDENARDTDDDAFLLVHTIVAARLRRGLLTVVDATNLQASARRPLLVMARRHRRPAVAVVLAVDEATLMRRGGSRPDRDLPAHVVRGHHALLSRALEALAQERFDAVHVLRSADEIDAVTVERTSGTMTPRHEASASPTLLDLLPDADS